VSGLNWTSISGDYRLAGINITMKFYALLLNAQWKIVAEVGSKSTVLEPYSPIPVNPAETRVYKDVREPNDALWNASDIQNLKVTVFLKATSSSGVSGFFRVHETWVNFPSGRVVFGVHVNDVFDMFAWQFRMNWTGTMFDVKRVTEGMFLKEAAIAHGADTLFIFKMYNGATGNYTLVSSVMQAPASRGVDGNGTLAWVELEVQGYGALIMQLYDTGLADSFNNEIAHTISDGYFKNKLNGEANGDGNVNSLDLGTLNGRWSPAGGTPPWSLGYSRDNDCNDDGYINSLDLGVVNGNWGRHYP
jgi:hypothetical protein